MHARVIVPGSLQSDTSVVMKQQQRHNSQQAEAHQLDDTMTSLLDYQRYSRLSTLLSNDCSDVHEFIFVQTEHVPVDVTTDIKTYRCRNLQTYSTGIKKDLQANKLLPLWLWKNISKQPLTVCNAGVQTYRWINVTVCFSRTPRNSLITF